MDLSSFLKYVIVIAIEVATSIAFPSEPSAAEAAVNLNRYEGKQSPNIGRPLTDSACVASS